jgi:hypothetical protein
MDVQRVWHIDIYLIVSQTRDALHADFRKVQANHADTDRRLKAIDYGKPNAVELPPLLSVAPFEILEQRDG